MKFLKSNIIQILKFNYSTLIDGSISKDSKKFLNAKEKSMEFLNAVNKIKIAFSDGGSERDKMRLRRMNKLNITDKLNALFDKSKYTEIFYYTGYDQIYGNIPKGGSISAIGNINNVLCVVIASNPIVKGGAIFPIQVRKQLRTQNLSLTLNLPLINIVDSAGAFLPLQADIFPDKDHGGRIFYNQAILQSKGIPVISLVCGSCTAGGAYIPTMSTENVMVDKMGHIFLGGPPLVKAATGEIISADELGGALVHNKISGCSDYMYEKEKEALSSIRNIVSTFPKQYYDLEGHENVDPLYPSHDLDGLLLNYDETPDQSRSTMTKILARILDASCLQEYKSEYGTSLITGFGKISGHRVGILASYGALSENDGLKGSNFIQICGQRSIPIISFIHSVEDISVANNDTCDFNGSVVKCKSSMMQSMATRNCKLITVVIGDAVGLDYICLGGLSMNPEFIFAWPNSRFGWSAKDLENSGTSSALKAAGNLAVDDIIDPANTRSVLSRYLYILKIRSDNSPQLKNQPVYRF